jgi:hypothetical protein
MQVLNAHGLEKRVRYSACTGQIHVGQNYAQLAEVITLTITSLTTT